MDAILKDNHNIERLLRKASNPSLYALILDKLEAYEYRKGETIYEPGDSDDDGMYIIINGSVDIRNRSGKIISTLKPGDYFGAESIVESSKERNEKATVTRDLLAASLPLKEYLSLCAKKPEIGKFISDSLYLSLAGREMTVSSEKKPKQRYMACFCGALFIIFFTSLFSLLLSSLSNGSSVTLGLLLTFFLGMAMSVFYWFCSAKATKKELGFDKLANSNSMLLSLAIIAELAALFFLGAMLADNAILPSLTITADINVYTVIAFIVLMALYLFIFIIFAGYYPTVIHELLPGKVGSVLAYILPVVSMMVIFGEIGGIYSSLWFGITTAALVIVRIKTKNTIYPCVAFVLSVTLGVFIFKISFMPLIFAF